MPVSPTPDDSYYWGIANAYKEAELEILGGIRDRLDKGQHLSDQQWATQRLAEVQVLRREATKVLAGVNKSMASQISGAFGNAYKDGELSALKDTAAFLPVKPSAVSSPARRAAVASLSRNQSQKIAGVMPGILRAAEDDYRSVVKSAVARVAAGGVDRRAATSVALKQAFGMGLKTGPGGKINLPDYITMSMRTGTANALIQGHLDTLEANGLDLVMIHPGPRACGRCDPWANKPLYRKSGKPGVHLFDSATSLQKVKVDVGGTLAQAKEAGWGHPNCRCGVGAYIPGASVTSPRPPWDEEGYKAQQRQRGLERGVREWKTAEALALDPKERLKAQLKVASWQAALRTLMKEYPELKRQSHRESINGTLGPKYNGPVEFVKPPPKPKPPKPPKETIAPVSLKPDLAAVDPIAAWTSVLLKSFPELPAGPVAKLLNPESTTLVKATALNDLYKNGWITKDKYWEALDVLDGTKPVAPPPPKPAPEPPKVSPKASELPKVSTPPPKPSTAWDGKSKPTPPTPPKATEQPKALDDGGRQAALDVWLEKVKAKYAAYAKQANLPKKTLEQSNNWNQVQAAYKNPSFENLKVLLDGKYIDYHLRNEAEAAGAIKPRLDPTAQKQFDADTRAYKKALEQYASDQIAYKANLAKWKTDNGITSAAKGFDDAVRHTTDQEGVKWAYANLPSPSATSVGGKAASRYTGSAYSSWNEALRQTKPGELPAGTYKNLTAQLDGAMGPMPTDVVLHRGTDFREFLSIGDLMPPPPPTSLIGKAYKNDGYASTSAGTRAAFNSKPVQLEIMVPKGHKALNVMPVSQFGNSEREILLSRGTVYYVHDVYQDGYTWRMKVEVVPEGEDVSLWEPIPHSR